MFENWNRYYDPSTGRYLSPEPMLQRASVARDMAVRGRAMPAYAYALNNPVHYVDQDGNQVGETIALGGALLSAAAAAAAAAAVAAILCAAHPKECADIILNPPFPFPSPIPDTHPLTPPCDTPVTEASRATKTCEKLFDLCYEKWRRPMNICDDCRSACKKADGAWPFHEIKCMSPE